MALNQVVMPGFAAFRIGMETDGPTPEPSIATLAMDDDDGMPLLLKDPAKSDESGETSPDGEETSE